MAYDTLPGLQGIGPAPVRFSKARSFIDARPNASSDPLSADDVSVLLKKRLTNVVDPPPSDPGTPLMQRGLALLDQSGQADPESASLSWWQGLSDRMAAQAPGREDYAVAGDEAQAEGMRRAHERYPDLPVPHMDPSQFKFPSLSLPTPPKLEQANLKDENPMAAIGSALAGILAPQYAGEFLASSLKGGLARVQQKNDLAQQEFTNAYQRQVQLNSEEIRKAEAEERIDHENRQQRYEEAVDTRVDQMRKASEYAKELTVQGTAEREKTLLEGTKRGREAAAGAERLRALLDQRFKAKEALQKQATSLIEAGGKISEGYQAAQSRIAEAQSSRQERVSHDVEMERLAGQRLDTFSLAPGAQRYQGGRPVANNPALPIPLAEGSGLVNRSTGAGVGPRIPKTPSANQKTLTPSQRLTQLRSQESQAHADTARLFEKRKKFRADWRKANPNGTSAQMFADPTYKHEFEAPEREARKKLNEVETQISDVMRGGTGSKSGAAQQSSPILSGSGKYRWTGSAWVPNK